MFYVKWMCLLHGDVVLFFDFVEGGIVIEEFEKRAGGERTRLLFE